MNAFRSICSVLDVSYHCFVSVLFTGPYLLEMKLEELFLLSIDYINSRIPCVCLSVCVSVCVCNF